MNIPRARAAAPAPALALSAAAAACAGLTGAVVAQAQSAAVYTDAQAQMGVNAYENNCAMCHGANMEGASGVTLLGPTFTSHYVTIGDLMQFMVQNMPKNNPGTLSHEDYVDILAFILLKNGWPSGSQALTFGGASASRMPFAQAAPSQSQ
ncbi:MAG TPA: c-type cytochrome [Steroidobacteraceae bacterium]|nr:c-type cytochrome [Steroidobacteraceae bacterium]